MSKIIPFHQCVWKRFRLKNGVYINYRICDVCGRVDIRSSPFACEECGKYKARHYTFYPQWNGPIIEYWLCRKDAQRILIPYIKEQGGHVSIN